jgi:hypothetical protein
MTDFHPLRRILVLLLSLLWATMGSATALVERGDLDLCSNAAKNAGKGLGNPFRGKTAAEIDEMFKAKGYELRGPDPLNGKGGYVIPKNQRSYHIDEANSFGEAPHVDVNRLKAYKGAQEKKKLEIGGGSGL